jgi:sucrose-6-phosphate hydrolase SacC (GH32 family)
MYFSWRSKHSIAVTESSDGFKWSTPKIVLVPSGETSWEYDVNRQCVLKKDNTYHMWYTGMSKGDIMDNSGDAKIGYAASSDGLTWKRLKDPVMVADQEWEQRCLMCPHVNWNNEKKVFQMYYSAGGWFEPDVIGYAESTDGKTWKKFGKPVFWPIYKNLWERERTTACQVIYHKGWY